MEGKLCRVNSATCLGLEVIEINIEVSIGRGLGVYLVGLPDNAVREALLRVSTSMESCGYSIPGKKIVINLAPANIRKEGSCYDLAIAISILVASGQLTPDCLDSFLILGELSLDGTLRDVPGALPIALQCGKMGLTKILLPEQSSAEAAEAGTVDVYGVANLLQAMDVLRGDGRDRYLVRPGCRETSAVKYDYDFADVKGQLFARRGLEIAASGGHNLILCGSPGSGKSLMAKCLPSILPPMSREESLETTMIYSVAGLSDKKGLISERPFRSPHHSASLVSFTGGGSRAMPGEISLAHNGVLYLDELPHYSPLLLNALRQPLEDRSISITRARYKVVYPASFMLVASMNPCPCGYFGDESHQCVCTPSMITHYLSRISGPLLDRIDINLKVKRVEGDFLISDSKSESSAAIAARVAAARQIQFERLNGSGIYVNSQMGANEIARFCRLDDSGKRWLKRLVERYAVSARGYSRILKIARTIADMDKKERISIEHISEAVQYRFQGNL